MTSQPGKQIIAIHILYNISTTKSNQAIRFGQLTEYNMRKNFLKKHHTQNVVEKLFPNPFLKNQNSGYLWICSLKVHPVCSS